MAANTKNVMAQAMALLEKRLTDLLPKLGAQMGEQVVSRNTPRRTREQQWEDFSAMSSADMEKLINLRGVGSVDAYISRMLELHLRPQAQGRKLWP